MKRFAWIFYALVLSLTITATARAADPKKEEPAVNKPPVYTLVIIHETYHGTSNVAIRGYPSLRLCEREATHVHQQGVQMSWEKNTDFLYTDSYCVLSYQ